MNKLAIARLVNTLAGTQGVVDTTENVSGYQNTLITFIDQAYSDIQLYRKDWKFMKAKTDAALSTSINTYSDSDIAYIERILYGTKVLEEIDYDTWILNTHPTGEPTEFTIDPYDDSIIFNPSDTNYIVTIQYKRVPDILTVNTSVPILPVRFHNIVAYKALIGLGSFLGNVDLIDRYANKYSVELGQLMRSQLPMKYLKTSPLVY